MRARLWIVVIFSIAVAASAHAGAPRQTPDADWAARCNALNMEDFSAIQDAPSQVIEAKVSESDDRLPPHCKVSGYVAPSVGFELRLPVRWNGKFVHLGCGSHCGTLASDDCRDALRKGYSCLVSDMGHKGRGDDAMWAFQNLQAKLDWGFRATHVATLAGKAITAHYYSRNARRSYFVGCSTGGRQALQEAQHFPWDFDGVVAGSPVLDLSSNIVSTVWNYRALHDSTGHALLTDEDLKLVTDSAIARCDLDDGIKDGIIGDPLHCPFDPGELTCRVNKARRCLTETQVDALRKIYAGPVNSKHEPLTPGGPVYGAEYKSLKGNQLGSFFGNELRLFLWPEPGLDWKLNAYTYDFGQDYKRTGLMQVLVDATNPDLRRFKAAGGKALVYEGMNDGVNSRSVIDYYEAVERAMGGRSATQDFFRLFMLPGVGHCGGGNGAWLTDYLGYLDSWVENGQAPDSLVAAQVDLDHFVETHDLNAESITEEWENFRTDSKNVKFTRPVYPYPVRIKYKGVGDPKNAASFGPVEP